MAHTFTSGKVSVFGNKRVAFGLMDFDNGTAGGSIATGLDYVESVSATPKSCNTNGGGFTINTTADGKILAASCTSGDNFYIVAIGR